MPIALSSFCVISTSQIHTVVSDNAPSSRAYTWNNHLRQLNIKGKHITSYSANANAVERQMKELGAGMRFRLNMNLQPAEFHRKWASELRFLQNTSNATPKAYVFAKLSTWIGESQLRSIRQSFHSLCSPLALAANKVMTMAESSMNLQISRKRDAAHKFIYDDRGFVNDYCDG
ncbi:hypothetical protein PGB90_005184 [Kerria lacca]